MKLGNCTLDPGTGDIFARDGTAVPTRRQARELLRVLAAAEGRPVTKDRLMDAIWPDVTVSEDSLYQAVAEARRAIGSDGSKLLLSVPREGYRLVAPAGRPPVTGRWRMVAAAGCAAGLIALAVASRPEAPPGGTRHPVVAVLPFEALVGADSLQRLGRGLSAEIAAALAQNRWLDVIAPEATETLAGQPPLAAAETLDASFVLDGSLAGDDSTLRVSARLTDAATGRVVWSDRWSRPPDSFLDLEGEILGGIGGALGGGLTGVITQAELDVARNRQPGSLDAYDHFLLGLEAKHHWNTEGFAAAVEHFRRAIDLDPQYAKAWSFLSLNLSFQALEAASDQDRRRLWDEAGSAAERAFALDPDDPEVLWRVARERAAHGDLVNAGKMLRRSVSLAPGNADVLMVAAWTSHYTGIRGEDPLEWSRRAQELTPIRPAKYTISHGLAAFSARDYRLAVETLRNAPPSVEVLAHLAAADALQGNVAAAREVARRLRAAYPDFVIDDLFGPAGLDGFPMLEDLRQGAVLAGLPLSRGGPG